MANRAKVYSQPLIMAAQTCNCWFFFISNKCNGLIFNNGSCYITYYQNNCRLLILESVQTCLNCPDRVAGETKTFTSQCNLRKGHEGIRNYNAYRVGFSASMFDTVCFYKDSFFISLCYFNQFDTTSKVMYRYEIICAGNTV